MKAQKKIVQCQCVIIILILFFFSVNESICCRFRSIANKYACLLTKFDADGTSNNISDIYLEVIFLVFNQKKSIILFFNIFFQSSNSSSYIQDAAQLLIPILQLSVI